MRLHVLLFSGFRWVYKGGVIGKKDGAGLWPASLPPVVAFASDFVLSGRRFVARRA